MQTQKSRIHFFLAKIEQLEIQLSKLKDFDRRIRIIANFEKRGQETMSVLGLGGPSPSDIRGKLKEGDDNKELIQYMRNDIERLQSEAISRGESLAELEKLLLARKEEMAHMPSIWPVQGWLTSGFGPRTNPFTGLLVMHEGIDISNRVGTQIVAPAAGIISDIAEDQILGKVLVISHGFGTNTRYAHLNKVLVKIGQRVKRGDMIAELGDTGRATGPHLHYEVRINGVPANPMKYILN
jgi:murein DD-endopeptidase MepM/ murein hydrolase activator NlpD